MPTPITRKKLQRIAFNVVFVLGAVISCVVTAALYLEGVPTSEYVVPGLVALAVSVGCATLAWVAAGLYVSWYNSSPARQLDRQYIH